LTLASSEAFTEKEKQLLLKNLSNRINKEGVIKIYSSESRSQHTNKEKVVKRLFKMIEKGLIVPKKRRPTKISRAQKIKRLDNKTKHATKKILRKKPTLEYTFVIHLLEPKSVIFSPQKMNNLYFGCNEI
jgi:ribosome-associated protein